MESPVDGVMESLEIPGSPVAIVLHLGLFAWVLPWFYHTTTVSG